MFGEDATVSVSFMHDSHPELAPEHFTPTQIVNMRGEALNALCEKIHARSLIPNPKTLKPGYTIGFQQACWEDTRHCKLEARILDPQSRTHHHHAFLTQQYAMFPFLTCEVKS